jgi:dipeptide/tripeptide permease
MQKSCYCRDVIARNTRILINLVFYFSVMTKLKNKNNYFVLNKIIILLATRVAVFVLFQDSAATSETQFKEQSRVKTVGPHTIRLDIIQAINLIRHGK